MTKKIICILLIISFVLLPSAIKCAYATDITDLRSIKINDGRSLYLEVGDEINLIIATTPENISTIGTIFSSSDVSIAKVSEDGLLKALKAGNTKITAELNGKKAYINVSVYVNKELKASFSEKTLLDNKVKEITISVNTTAQSENGNNGSNNTGPSTSQPMYIFLPTGYMVEGTTATFAADRNGVYPFTVYNGSNSKKTFYYEINDLKKANLYTENTEEITDFNLNTLYENINLQYDYEKKQCLLNAQLDKIRYVSLDGKAEIKTNEINYYIPNIKNNTISEHIISVEGKYLKFKIKRQGEFYLLMTWQNALNDNRKNLVSYKAYNFTLNYDLSTEPNQDLITDNGVYEVVAYSEYGQKEIFTFNITDIDYMRPEINVAMTSDNLFELTIKDNLNLEYIITSDGKFEKISKYAPNEDYIFLEKKEFIYNGEYTFIACDASGNRSVESINISKYKNVPYVKNLSYNVHNSSNTVYLFNSYGEPYYNYSKDLILFDNIQPAYMKGISNNKFDPYGTITRAQMVTILCRLTDLPYDVNLGSKNKFTDIDGHWAYNYINMGSSKKYIQGYKDKTFKPNKTLNRADFCKMICNISALKGKISKIPSINNYNFSDITSNYSYAKVEMLKLANRGIISVSGDKIYPGKPISRAEVVYAINKIFDLSPSIYEINYIENLYTKYYNFSDIINHPYYNDLIVSIVGMYREIR